MPTTFQEAHSPLLGQITFRQLADAMPQMVWSTLPDGLHDYYNARWYEFTGAPVGSTDGEGWNDMFHPEDQERAWTVWRRSLETGEPYEIEYRLRHHSGEYRWALGRALPVRGPEGQIVRWVGTCTDIHEHKQSEQLNAVLSRELSHRIKNIFAVIGGIIGISSRQFPQLETLANQLQSRVAALGRAHDYARPHSEDSAPHGGPSQLTEMLRQLLSPYPALDEGRITIEGEQLTVDDRGATPIGLTFHELATNSMKYGALSASDGQVRIVVSSEDGNVTIEWIETGGPPVVKPDFIGFGTELTEIAIVAQLGGTIDRDWLPEGLRVTIRILAERLRR